MAATLMSVLCEQPQVVVLRHHRSLGVCRWLTKGTMELVRFSAMWQLALAKWCNNLPLLSQTSSSTDTHTRTHTHTHSPPPPLLPFALPIPTGTDNIVLSYKKDFFSPPSIAVIIELMQMERDICMLKCWPLSYAQQMFPCHLLKLCCLDTLRERERERVRESYSPRRHCLTALRVSATKFCICPSSNSRLSSLVLFLNNGYIAIIWFIIKARQGDLYRLTTEAIQSALNEANCF